MRNIATLILLLSIAACAQPKIQAQTEPQVLELSLYHSPLIDNEVAKNDPYDIDFDIEKSKEGQHLLVVKVSPKGGSFFVSPHSTQDFKGKFRVNLSENNFLSLSEDFEEIPRSKEVIDNHPFAKDAVNWVQTETTYKYPLTIHSEEDFVIGAEVAFVIEPKCILEQVYFKIFHSNGNVKVELGGC